jgi:transglutaminase-like putative cysteine protease
MPAGPSTLDINHATGAAWQKPCHASEPPVSFYPTPRPTFIGVLPDGDEGIRQTLRTMVAIARQAKKDPAIRQVAAKLVRNLPQYDVSAAVRALQGFVRDTIRYTGDIDQVETVQWPQATLEMGIGDCDDKALLLGVLLLSIGIPARFIAIGINGSTKIDHVLVEARLGSAKNWYPLETIKPVPAGWKPKNISRGMVAHV